MRLSSIIIALIYLGFSFASTEDQKLSFKEIGWTVTIPSKIKILDVNKGSPTKTLVRCSNGLDWFEATITPLDSSRSDYQRFVQKHKEWIYQVIANKNPDATVDSFSNKQLISNLTFERFEIIVKAKVLDKEVYQLTMFYKSYRGFDFQIGYLSETAKFKQQVQKILNTSTFE